MEKKLEKVHRVIGFNKKAWLTPCINMKTELQIKAKNGFEINFCKQIKISPYKRNMESVRKHRDFKLLTTKAKRS